MEVFNTVVGIITIIGLIITICQIYKTHSAAEAAKQASIETKMRVDASFLLPDIAALIQHARFVKENALDGRIEAARFRLQDIKDGIVKYERPLQNDLRQYAKTVGKIDLCLRSLEIYQLGKGDLERNQFCIDIEEIISGLNGIQNEIKANVI